MTAITTTASVMPRFTPQQIALAATAVMLAPLLPTALAAAVDPRLFNGADPFLKPLHFQLSLAVHFITLAILMPLVSQSWQEARLLRWPLLAAAFSAPMEVIYITLQAARGQASHFNQDTALAGALYGLMGIGSLTLIAASAIIGFAIWRSIPRSRSSSFKQGAILGLILGSATTLVVAGYMSSGQSHLVGGPQTDAYGLPFLGWSARSGDLRVPHFFATHMMQALPLAGLAADRLGLRSATWLMPSLAALYLVATLALFGEALLGIPLIRY